MHTVQTKHNIQTPLEHAIWQTVRYFDAFALPVTSVQIWRGLVRLKGQPPLAGVRLAAVAEALQTSPYLRARLVSCWGYWAPAAAGRNNAELRQYVRARLRRHVLAQHKWRRLRRISRLMVAVPFVRMVGGSGSLALFNTTWMSDLDVYIVARAGRIWTARLLLLLTMQLLGCRRTYGEAHAPDKVCLNHYVTDRNLVMAPDNRSLYTAQQYRRMTLIWGESMWRRWQTANDSWLAEQLAADPASLFLPGIQAVRLPAAIERLKRMAEGWLLEFPGDWLERRAEGMQRRAVERHTRPGQRGRVVLSAGELAFHPDNRAPEILRHFSPSDQLAF